MGTSEWRDKLLLNIVHGSAVTRSKKLINCTSIITLEHVHVTIGANNTDSVLPIINGKFELFKIKLAFIHTDTRRSKLSMFNWEFLSRKRKTNSPLSNRPLGSGFQMWCY